MMAAVAPDFEALREKMDQEQLVARNITDRFVLAAMQQVPRHLFVPQDTQHVAYWDGPLSIGEGQTISQPYIVALMTQLLSLQGDEKVLEIGCGSGYQAAVLACLAEQVFTIERHASLAGKASERLEQLGYSNVTVKVGDGTEGLPAEAPYDAIIITAATPSIPAPLRTPVAKGGRIVAPVGNLGSQTLKVCQRKGSDWTTDYSIPVMFVPLVGKHGWKEGAWQHDRW